MPAWIILVGIVAAFAPVPGIAASLVVLLVGVIVVPVIITGLLCPPRE